MLKQIFRAIAPRLLARGTSAFLVLFIYVLFRFNFINQSFLYLTSSLFQSVSSISLNLQVQSQLRTFNPDNSKWFHTDFFIPICKFDYQLHLIKPWFFRVSVDERTMAETVGKFFLSLEILQTCNVIRKIR